MLDDTAWAVNSAVECYPHTVEVRGSNPLPPTITAEHFPPWSFYLKMEVAFNEPGFFHPTTIHPPIWKTRDGAGHGVVHASTGDRWRDGLFTPRGLTRLRQLTDWRKRRQRATLSPGERAASVASGARGPFLPCGSTTSTELTNSGTSGGVYRKIKAGSGDLIRH